MKARFFQSGLTGVVAIAAFALPASVSAADIPSAGPAAQAALGVFSSGTVTLAPAAYALQGYKYNRAIMLPTVTRITQAIVGELSADEALTKVGTDIAESVKQAEK